MPTASPVHPDVKKILLSETALRDRIRELGAQITRDYADRRLLVVGVLKGSVIFLADLLRAIGPEVVDLVHQVNVEGQGGDNRACRKGLKQIRASRFGRRTIVLGRRRIGILRGTHSSTPDSFKYIDSKRSVLRFTG